MAKKQLSIIIPTWNTADTTHKCVASIIKNLPTGVEIIVVDNGSTDNTIAKLQKLKTVKLIKNSKNLGFSKANNIGANQAVGEYLLFLNSDMKLIDNSLLKILSYLQRHPDVGVAGPQFLNPNGTLQSSVFPPQNILNAFKEFWLGQKSYSKYQPLSAFPISVWAISGGAILISKKLFSKINGWNENYFFYYEDLDLCRKIRLSNKKIIFFPQCKIVHYHGASGKSLADSSNQWRRLIPSSKIYFGIFQHFFINFIIWFGQKWRKTFFKS